MFLKAIARFNSCETSLEVAAANFDFNETLDKAHIAKINFHEMTAKNRKNKYSKKVFLQGM